MMNSSYLSLWLEAPLQSWGYDSRFGRRDSLDFPTKSGLLGLLCCARGAGGEEKEWLELWANLDCHIVAYSLTSHEGISSASRLLLRDFHMVGSGYDDQDPWASLLIPKTELGKKAVGGGTKITHRYYLQDMAFAVFMQAPDSIIQETVTKLKNPVWDLYLGRKSCAPTDFIFRGLFDSCEEALSESACLAKEKGRSFSFRVLQGHHEGEVLSLNDIPVSFGLNKQYRDRLVTVQRWP